MSNERGGLAGQPALNGLLMHPVAMLCPHALHAWAQAYERGTQQSLQDVLSAFTQARRSDIDWRTRAWPVQPLPLSALMIGLSLMVVEAEGCISRDANPDSRSIQRQPGLRLAAGRLLGNLRLTGNVQHSIQIHMSLHQLSEPRDKVCGDIAVTRHVQPQMTLRNLDCVVLQKAGRAFQGPQWLTADHDESAVLMDSCTA